MPCFTLWFLYSLLHKTEQMDDLDFPDIVDEAPDSDSDSEDDSDEDSD